MEINQHHIGNNMGTTHLSEQAHTATTRTSTPFVAPAAPAPTSVINPQAAQPTPAQKIPDVKCPSKRKQPAPGAIIAAGSAGGSQSQASSKGEQSNKKQCRLPPKPNSAAAGSTAVKSTTLPTKPASSKPFGATSDTSAGAAAGTSNATAAGVPSPPAAASTTPNDTAPQQHSKPTSHRLGCSKCRYSTDGCAACQPVSSASKKLKASLDNAMKQVGKIATAVTEFEEKQTTVAHDGSADVGACNNKGLQDLIKSRDLLFPANAGQGILYQACQVFGDAKNVIDQMNARLSRAIVMAGGEPNNTSGTGGAAGVMETPAIATEPAATGPSTTTAAPAVAAAAATTAAFPSPTSLAFPQTLEHNAQSFISDLMGAYKADLEQQAAAIKAELSDANAQLVVELSLANKRADEAEKRCEKFEREAKKLGLFRQNAIDSILEFQKKYPQLALRAAAVGSDAGPLGQ